MLFLANGYSEYSNLSDGSFILIFHQILATNLQGIV